ncbi:glycoside hydrolase [Serendipita vermifera]|nr:glycoside hydrolase [Serendipita vermifera]
MKLAFTSILLACLQFSGLVAAGVTIDSNSGTGDRGRVPRGFVTTKGTKFRLDNKDFAFVGSNSYWLPLLTTKEDVDLTLKDARAAGIKVMRTWGFNAINATELPTALSTNLTYYQIWNGTRFDTNYGAQGLQRLDYVVKAAERFGVKLILAFTNNWGGYGGADLYVQWIKGVRTHDTFFTDPAVIAEYQRYVKIIVNRYKDSPAIFAWELMNEARCLGELPSGPDCPGKRVVGKWYKQQSDYVRKLDPYHMISTGGEGHFFWDPAPTFWYNGTEVSDYNYNGQAGEDFDEDLKLDNHIYVYSWYPQLVFPGSNFSAYEWGLQWIQQHADGKYTTSTGAVTHRLQRPKRDKLKFYPGWVKKALDTYHGIMPWQYGQLGLTENGGNRLIKYADAIIDGNQTDIWSIFTRAAAVQDSRSR